MFNLVHLIQEKGWRLKEAIIITHTNPFNTQREQVGIISLSKRITATTRVQHLDAKDLIKGIRDISHQNNLKSSTPLITDLRMDWTFKNKTKKEGVSIINLVLLILQLLREDI